MNLCATATTCRSAITVASILLFTACGGGGSSSSSSGSASEAVIYSFGGMSSDGNAPEAGLIQGADAAFYGTTLQGGTSGLGTVFRLTTAGVETALHSFSGGTDGENPVAGLTLATDGNFYGATKAGGQNNQGTVFKITPAGAETLFYSFTGASAGGSDGANPSGDLIQGSDGNFYGTTSLGGTSKNCDGGCGTVFRITKTGVETVLYSFTGGVDAIFPTAGLVQGSDGNFYGMTTNGGSGSCSGGCGTVFRVTPSGVETVLHSFASGSDGANPYGSLIQATDGNFYGTTYLGGVNNKGTIFKITPSGMETVLHSFAGGSDGAGPQLGFAQGTDGDFYGTTTTGGVGGCSGGCGTVFKITPAGDETVLYSFAGGAKSDGQVPVGLVQGSDHSFYGTTSAGGAFSGGAVFKLGVPGS